MNDIRFNVGDYVVAYKNYETIDRYKKFLETTGFNLFEKWQINIVPISYKRYIFKEGDYIKYNDEFINNNTDDIFLLLSPITSILSSITNKYEDVSNIKNLRTKKINGSFLYMFRPLTDFELKKLKYSL